MNRTLLGLTTACLTCHEDHHAGQLRKDCQACHDFSHWKPVRSFEHSSTHFPLTGRHQDVPCAKCHRPMPDDAKVIQYAKLNFAECTGCHQDPHHGAFAARCESCHNTDNWRPVRLSSEFDHGKTKFPLTGKHDGLACRKCHKDANFKAAIAHAGCMDCHQDRHKGQFQHRADHGECASCHRDGGFRPATFSETRHQSTAFPLTGKHQGVACAKCHAPAGLDANYHPAFQACLDCHRDPHGGQFAGAPFLNRCEDCHTTDGFHPSTFSLARHQTTSFALKGAHGAVACLDCHRRESGPGGADRQFHFASHTCEGCHRDPHRSEFPAVLRSSLKAGQDLCETCHGLRSWQQLKAFDHATTGYQLSGAHRVLGCKDCHRATSESAGLRQIPLKTAPDRCAGCHEDIHAGQFQRGADPADCSNCHTPTRWIASVFNHDRGTNFSLSGAHANVPCRLCHLPRQDGGGRRVVVYKGTPRACQACHR